MSHSPGSIMSPIPSEQLPIKSKCYGYSDPWEHRLLSSRKYIFHSFYLSLCTPPQLGPHLWTSHTTNLRRFEREHSIIIGPAYSDYESVLSTLSLPRLSVEYEETLKKFGEGLLKHPRHPNLLPPMPLPPSVLQDRNTLIPIKALRTARFNKNAIPSIVRTLNSM